MGEEISNSEMSEKRVAWSDSLGSSMSRCRAFMIYRFWMLLNAIRHLPRTLVRFSSTEARGIYRISSGLTRWVSADAMSKSITTAPIDKQFDMYIKLKKDQTRNWKITFAVLAILLLGNIFLFNQFGYITLVVFFLVVLGLSYVVGYPGSKAEGAKEPPIHPLAEGMPLTSLRKSIEYILEERCKTEAHVSVKNAKNGWTFVLSFITSRPNDDKIIKELEEGLGAPHNSIFLVEDPKNAANELGEIQLTDPLENTPYLDSLPPNSLTINELIPVGMNRDGSTLALNFCRTNWLFVGRSDSGKSSALNAVGLRLSECRDAHLSSVDITGAVTFAVHRGCIRRRAETNEEATQLLRDELDIVDDRTRKMSANLETGDVVSSLVPTPDVPARVLMIDELPALSDDTVFIRLLLLYLMRGRKVACTAVIGTQGVSEKVAGSATFREAVHGLVMFGCGELDIKNALGSDARSKGWRADTLTSQGSAYIRDRKRTTPEVSRFSYVAVQDVADRSMELQHHQPRSPIPVILSEVASVFDEEGSDFCEQQRVIEILGSEMNKTQLKNDLLSHGVRLRMNNAVDGRPRGYFRSDIQAVIEKLS